MASFYAKEGHVNSVMYRIAHLHPGMPLNIINTAILDQPTVLQSEASIKTADGKQALLRTRSHSSIDLKSLCFVRMEHP